MNQHQIPTGVVSFLKDGIEALKNKDVKQMHAQAALARSQAQMIHAGLAIDSANAASGKGTRKEFLF
jgi:hypothetical protein